MFIDGGAFRSDELSLLGGSGGVFSEFPVVPFGGSGGVFFGIAGVAGVIVWLAWWGATVFAKCAGWRFVAVWGKVALCLLCGARFLRGCGGIGDSESCCDAESDNGERHDDVFC